MLILLVMGAFFYGFVDLKYETDNHKIRSYQLLAFSFLVTYFKFIFLFSNLDSATSLLQVYKVIYSYSKKNW